MEIVNIVTEINKIRKSNDIEGYMNNPASTVTNRVTPMFIGLYTDADFKQVNTWLHNMHEEKLSPRNPYEAMFMYVYGKYKKEERLTKWFELYNKYKPVIEKHMSERKGTEIVTYGNLCDLLKNASATSDDKTYVTKNYTQNTIVPELDKAVESDSEDAFGEYLNFIFTDKETLAYDRKAAYYLRKFVYEVLTDGLYMLFDRHGYEYRKEENERVRVLALKNVESFNKFINEFNLCFYDINEHPKLSEKCNNFNQRKENCKKKQTKGIVPEGGTVKEICRKAEDGAKGCNEYCIENHGKKCEFCIKLFKENNCINCSLECVHNENLKEESLRRSVRKALEKKNKDEGYNTCKEWLKKKQVDFVALHSAFNEFYGKAHIHTSEYAIIAGSLGRNEQTPMEIRIERLEKILNECIRVEEVDSVKKVKFKAPEKGDYERIKNTFKRYDEKKQLSDGKIFCPSEDFMCWEDYENEKQQKGERYATINRFLIESYLDYVKNKKDKFFIEEEFSCEDYMILKAAFEEEKPFKLSDESVFEPKKELLPWEEYEEERKKDSEKHERINRFFIDKYAEQMKKRNKREHERFYDMLCEKISVSRKVLVNFGFFAGYSVDVLNDILNNCGFEKISADIEMDWVVLELDDRKYQNAVFSKKINCVTYYTKSGDKSELTQWGIIRSEKEDSGENIRRILNEQDRNITENVNSMIYTIELDESLPSLVEYFNTAGMVNIMNKEAQQLKNIEEKLNKEKK